MQVDLYPYLGINPDGSFELAVSTQKLNRVGARLEKGYRLPAEVYDQFQNPLDSQMAIDGLRSLREFLTGESAQNHGLVFGQPLPKRKHKTVTRQ